MKELIIAFLLITGMIALWIIREPDMNRYNKYVCANYGLQEDCKTPLPISQRLK